MKHSRGSVLILVLWTLSLFAVYAVSLGAGARTRASLLGRTQLLASLETIAYSGIERAKAAVINDPTTDLDTLTDDWANSPPQFYDIAVGDGHFRVGWSIPGSPGEFRAGVVDEESKINLNKAEPIVIARLIEDVAGLDPEKATELAYNIVDWRDQDSNFGHPQYGAEKEYYDHQEASYPCKNAPMETLEELLLIKGINRSIFDKIIPFVTLYGTGSMNVNTASRQSLSALGLAERTVDKILAYRAGTDGKPGTADDAVFGTAGAIVGQLDRAVPPLDNEERVLISGLVEKETLGTVSSYFSAHSQGVALSGATLDIDAVFDRSGKVCSVRSSGVKWPARV